MLVRSALAPIVHWCSSLSLMHDMANVRDAPVIWRLQTHSDLRASSSNHGDNHKGYRFFCFSLRVMNNCLSNMSLWLSIKMLLIFLKMGQTAVLLCFCSDDGCGHFVTISFYGRLQSEESFQITVSALTNQRPVFRRGDQSEAFSILTIRGKSSTQCYCQSTEWTGEGLWFDQIYLMLLNLQTGLFVRQELNLHLEYSGNKIWDMRHVTQ